MATLIATEEKIAEHLRHLLSINLAGLDGYKQSAKNATNPEFRSLFNDYIIQREDYAGELKAAIRALGAKTDDVTPGITGAIHRLWIDIKRTISNDEERTALEACAADERAAISEYQSVLNNTEFNEELRELLIDQKKGLERALVQSEQLGSLY